MNITTPRIVQILNPFAILLILYSIPRVILIPVFIAAGLLQDKQAIFINKVAWVVACICAGLYSTIKLSGVLNKTRGDRCFYFALPLLFAFMAIVFTHYLDTSLSFLK